MSAPLIFCQDCRKPWGIRDGTDADLRAAYAEWWQGEWDTARLPVAPLPDLPATRETRIVYFSEANCDWLFERGFEPEIAEPPCWMDLGEHHCGVPEWWVNPRAKAAVRWDHGCCDLPDAWPLVHAAAVALAEKAEKDDATFGGRLVAGPAFVEWMQCIPDGWVTSLPIARTNQLKILGNGVVPPQAAHAFDHLFRRFQ